ncbi:MAG: DUF4190 domain-containing protein [Planctomycetota bacterium]
MATTSLILAIASLPLTLLCLTGVLTAVVAIPLGHVAVHRARNSANPLRTKNKAVAALMVSYLYIGFAIILVARVISNRVSRTELISRTVLSDNTGMNFTIHTPLNGTSSEWQVKYRDPLTFVMGPKDVQVSAQQRDVAIPIRPQNARDFQYLSINLVPKKYNGAIVDVARKYISGIRVFDKNYNAEDPELLTISATSSAFFRESLVINGSEAKGIAFLVPCSQGYYLLSFRCDPNSYNESFYTRIAATFTPKDK